jgi:hypothetical protein
MLYVKFLHELQQRLFIKVSSLLLSQYLPTLVNFSFVEVILVDKRQRL